MFASICTNPDFLKVMYTLNIFITIAKILLPLIIIVKTSLNIGKLVISGNADTLKAAVNKFKNSIIAAVLIFFIPTIVDVIFGFVDTGVSVNSCFNNATKEQVQLAYLREAEELVTLCESSLSRTDYSEAYSVVSKLEDSREKENYMARLETVSKTIDEMKSIGNIIQYIKPIEKKNHSSSGTTSGKGTLQASGSYYSSGKGVASVETSLAYEPDPSAAINYWAKTNMLDASNFIYPKDEKTGLSLGAWPKNYKDYPSQLSNYKTYYNGTFIFPVTPSNGVYSYVYYHNGIDIMATFGTPIYSPVDGTMTYSEWGHTVNRGGDETAYSISITLDKSLNVSGKSVDTLFLTHMSGIRYRCSSCNQRVKKGELLGFIGNASGSATDVGWAPHLHMTLYPVSNYSGGIYTDTFQETIYGIKVGETYSVVAGG